MSLILGADLQGLIATNAAAMAPNFVTIHGGKFQMGATDIGNDEKPVHEVIVSPFRMGKYPVTVGEYRALVDRLGNKRFALLFGSESVRPKVVALAESADELEKIGALDLLGSLNVADLMQEGANHFSRLKIVEMRMPELGSRFAQARQPMVVVDWYESVVHALLRGALLATEAQWEYGATCGGRFKYGTVSGELKRGEAHYHPHAEGVTAEVGQYPSNEFGLHDMTGNVWEWCMNWYGPYPSETQKNPTGPASGESRVLRGGSWGNVSPVNLRAAYRGNYVPENQYNGVGFRLVAPQDS